MEQRKQQFINKCSYLKQHPMIFKCISIITFLIIKHNKNNINQIEEIITHLLMNGQCFINHDEQIISYDNVTIEKNKYYKFTLNDKSHITNKVRMITLNHQIISPFDLSLKFSNTLNIIHQYINNIVKTGGRPSGIFSINNLGSQNNKDEIKQKLYHFLSNLGNQNTSMVIEGNYQWQNLGSTPNEIQILDIQKEMYRSICMCFNIPPVLTGTEEKVYTSNHTSTRKQFTEDYILPLYEMICNKIKN